MGLLDVGVYDERVRLGRGILVRMVLAENGWVPLQDMFECTMPGPYVRYRYQCRTAMHTCWALRTCFECNDAIVPRFIARFKQVSVWYDGRVRNGCSAAAELQTHPDRLVSSRPPPEPTTTRSNAGMRHRKERTGSKLSTGWIQRLVK